MTCAKLERERRPPLLGRHRVGELGLAEGSGLNAELSAARVTPPPANQLTGRQRGDTGRPSGNSRSRNAVGPKMAGIASQVPSHAIHWSPGNGPAAVVALASA